MVYFLGHSVYLMMTMIRPIISINGSSATCSRSGLASDDNQSHRLLLRQWQHI